MKRVQTEELCFQVKKLPGWGSKSITKGPKGDILIIQGLGQGGSLSAGKAKTFEHQRQRNNFFRAATDMTTYKIHFLGQHENVTFIAL